MSCRAVLRWQSAVPHMPPPHTQALRHPGTQEPVCAVPSALALALTLLLS